MGKSSSKRDGLFLYTVACVGILKTVMAYHRAPEGNESQAIAKARAHHPGRLGYTVVAAKPCSTY